MAADEENLVISDIARRVLGEWAIQRALHRKITSDEEQVQRLMRK
jgi:hypothetical protein